MEPQTIKPQWNALIILGCLAFAVALSSYIAIGATARYMQDDYCYSITLAGKGFWQGQIDSYLHETPYDAERFSLTLGMALSEAAGRWTVTVLPGFMVLLLVGGLYGILRRVEPVGGPVLSRIQALVVAEALTLFSIAMAPNWVQVVYWRAGMFTYFAPLVCGTYLVLILLDAGQRRKWRGFRLACVFILALLAGGFSESATAVLVSALTIALGLVSLGGKKYRPWLFPLGMALTGGIMAMVVLLISPGNVLRLATSYAEPSGLRTTVVGTLYNAVYFYIYTAYRQTLPYTFVFIFFGLFALLVDSRQREIRPTSSRSLVLGIAVWLGGTFILTAAVMAPGQYLESSYPAARVLIIPRFVSVVAGAYLSSLVGRLIGNWFKNPSNLRIILIALCVVLVLFFGLWLAASQNHFTPPAFPDLRAYLRVHWPIAAAFVLVGLILGALLTWRSRNQIVLTVLFGICLLQPLLVATRVYSALPAFQDRAAMWDQREVQILQARANGEQEITVRALDSLAGIAELSDNPGYWVNNCAARYYEVKSIRAIEPVLNHFESIIP